MENNITEYTRQYYRTGGSEAFDHGIGIFDNEGDDDAPEGLQEYDQQDESVVAVEEALGLNGRVVLR
jgi:hypothetical protein